MRFDLTCHPATPMPEVRSIAAYAERTGVGQVNVRYVVHGDIGGIVVPMVMPPERADDLWRTTCFEMFLGVPDRAEYLELNLSPSSRWAAYDFDDYRQRGPGVTLLAVPRVDLRAGTDTLECSVRMDIKELVPAGGDRRDWIVNIAAVIEAKDGRMSYWALAHGDGAPDFHRRDCFVGILPSPTPA